VSRSRQDAATTEKLSVINSKDFNRKEYRIGFAGNHRTISAVPWGGTDHGKESQNPRGG
jgi:hypothetical protein